MARQLYKRKEYWILVPIFGVLLFVVLYIVATFLYPGGSQVDKSSVGFSWLDNYWCNLLNEKAINGQFNPARPIAISGMLVLASTLSFFWLLFPGETKMTRFGKLSIQVSGILAMATSFFLVTDINHDLVINLASFFGFVAITGTFYGLYSIKWYGLLAFGLVNVLLVGVNNYMYYNKELIAYLPVVQKISFATVLIWICCIDINLYHLRRAAKSQL